MISPKYNRSSLRLPEYDYSLSGEYFIAICIHNRECLLGEVVNEKMILNKYGELVAQSWGNLPKHYSRLSLGE